MESVSGGLAHPGLRHSRINETVSDKRRVGDLRRQPIRAVSGAPLEGFE